MSGTQGRFPPAMPPDHQGGAQQGGTVNWPPAVPQQPQFQQPQLPPQQQHPSFPPRFQAQPPALPGQGMAGQGMQGQGFQESAPPLPPQLAPLPPQQAWAPAPPQPFPGQPAASRMPDASRMQDSVTRPPQQAFAPAPRQPDAAAYDLGNYGMPNGGAPRGQPQTQPSVQPGTQHSARDPQQQQWQPQGQPQFPPQFQPDPYAQQRQAQPVPLQAGQGYPPMPQQQLPPQNQYAGSGALAPQEGQPRQPEAPAAEEEYEYEDEPPRRSRRWLIALALIGSIGAGGAMAYGYKQYFGPKPNEKTQVVRAPREPAKTTPADRGGKQMANTGSPSLNNRLPSDGSSNAPGGEVGGAGTTDANGVRRVSTVPVGREPPAVSGSPVPGMQIVANPGGFPTPGAVVQPSAAPQRQAAVPVAQVPAPAPPRQPARVQAAEPEAAPAPPPKRQVVAAAPRDPAAAPAKTSGFVAVLGYRRSQLDAMKAMADVQQRFDMLRDKKLEIVQSDETARGLGVIYRIVVGPRGNMGTAREVCTQLQQAGMPAGGCYTHSLAN